MKAGYWRGIGGTAVTITLLTGSETSLLYCLMALLAGGFSQAPLAWGWLWLLGLVAFFLPRVMSDLSQRPYAAAVAASACLSTLVAVHHAGYPMEPFWSTGWVEDAVRSASGLSSRSSVSILLVILAGIAVWWRQVARETPGSDAVGTTFRLGPVPVTALMVLGVASWGTDGPDIARLAWQVAYFFGLCLLALAHVRWSETPRRDSRAISSLARWLSTSMGPLLLSLAAAFVISSLLFGRIAPVLTVLLRGAGTLVSWILLAFAWALGLLAWLVANLLWLIYQALRLNEAGNRPESAPDQTERILEVLRSQQGTPRPYFWVLLLLVVAVSLWAIARYRPRRESTAGSPISRESVWERPDLTAGLSAVLSRLQRSLPAFNPDPLRVLLADPVWRHTGEVRKAYRDTARLYDHAGIGRPSAHTAKEHAEANASAALRELTALYEQARYSTRPVSADAAQRADALRHAIAQELRKDQSSVPDRTGYTRKEPPAI